MNTEGLRKVARLWSVLNPLFIAAIFFGEGVHFTELTAYEKVGFLFFPCGVVAGLWLAWWRERWGALLTIGSLVAFYFVLCLDGRCPRGPYFLLIAAPALLFLRLGSRS